MDDEFDDMDFENECSNFDDEIDERDILEGDEDGHSLSETFGSKNVAGKSLGVHSPCAEGSSAAAVERSARMKCKKAQTVSRVARALFVARKSSKQKNHLKEQGVAALATCTNSVSQPSLLATPLVVPASPLSGSRLGVASARVGAERVVKAECEPVTDFHLVPYDRNDSAVLKVCEISDACPRFCFEGKILNKYGTYKLRVELKPDGTPALARYLKCDLTDVLGFDTITLSIADPYIGVFEKKIVVGEFIRIEGPVVKPKNRNDGGTSFFSMHIDATTSIIKAEPFSVSLSFCPEHKIKDFLEVVRVAASNNSKNLLGTLAFVVIDVDKALKGANNNIEQLTIADGVSPFDRANLCFVNERKADYHHMVEQFEESGLVLMVARNIGVWLSRSNTLSILDATILTGVTNPRLLAELKEVFRVQVSSLGYGKEVFGTLEFTNINSVLVQNVCSNCKSWKVRRIAHDEGHCYTCSKPVTILQLPRLEGKITSRDRSTTFVSVVGNIADKVLELGEPFRDLYARNVHEARETLAYVKKVGTFVLNHVGRVMSYTAANASQLI